MEAVGTLDTDVRLCLPAHALFVGSTSSGKTRLCLHLLTHPHLFTQPPQRVYFYFDQLQDSYLEAKRSLEARGIEMLLRRGSDVDLDELEALTGQSVVVIDDATEQTANSPKIARIFTNGRHKRVSCWLLWHALYHKYSASRLISQNAQLYFMLPSVRLESQLRTFGVQLGLKAKLLEAYSMCLEDSVAASSGHRYLLVDLCPHTPSQLRLRSRIHLTTQCCYL